MSLSLGGLHADLDPRLVLGSIKAHTTDSWFRNRNPSGMLIS
jgi:hypothetical protein